MLKEIVAGAVTVATAFIGAGIVYQIVKPGTAAAGEIQTLSSTATSLGGDLFKG
jgi:hypothetical protein